jgi:hypothetical protein
MSSLRSLSLREILTFTRASAGTYCNAAGVLATAAVDESRIEFEPATHVARGLLIEPAATNYLLRSQEFDNASWTKTRASVTANQYIAPDATLTADKLIEDTTASDSHYLAQSYTKTSSSEVQYYAASVWIKAAERTQVRVQCQGTTGSANMAQVTFDLAAGTAGTPVLAGQYDNTHARIEAWPGGWYRCIVEFRINNDGVSGVQMVVLLLGPTGSSSYSGDGASGVYVWGAQLEKSSHATSYVVTTTASASRSHDVAKLTNLAPWFNDAEGTLCAEYMVPWTYNGDAALISRRVAQFDDGTENNRILAYINGGLRYFSLTTGGVAQASASRGSHSPGVTQLQAMSWAKNDVLMTASGSTVSADTSATIPAGITTLRLGTSVTTSELSGYIRRVRYWPRAMGDTELQALVA